MSNPIKFLSEGVVLLAVSATAYFGTYLYAVSYASHFGIPKECVSVSLDNILVFGRTTMTLCIISYGFFSMIYFAPTLVRSRSLMDVQQAFWHRYSIFYFILLLSWFITSHFQYSGHICFGLMLLPLSEFVIPFFRDRNKSYSDRFLQMYNSPDEKRPENPEDPFVANSPFHRIVTGGAKNFLMALVLAIGLTHICSLVGTMDAGSRKAFAVFDDYALIGRFGENFVFCRFDRKTQTTQGEFLMQSITGLTNTLAVEDIGPLKYVKYTRSTTTTK